jgi:hypothetical protein
MGATGSYCNCSEKWWSLSDSTILQERFNALEKKYITMETNTNTLHTKYSTLEVKLEQMQKKVANAFIELEAMDIKLNVVEKRASIMIHTQEEMDCDMVIIE